MEEFSVLLKGRLQKNMAEPISLLFERKGERPNEPFTFGKAEDAFFEIYSYIDPTRCDDDEFEIEND